jgi:hypothetical protein
MRVFSRLTEGRHSISKTVIVQVLMTTVISLFYSEFAIAQEEKPVIHIQTNPGKYLIKAEMLVPRSADIIYRTCTDYESIDEHISLFKISRILQRKKNTVHLYQLHSFKILFFECETESYLEILENPLRGFSFRETKGNYKVHRGSWILVPQVEDRSCLIKYEIQAIPSFYVPRWLVVYFMKRDIRKSFNELYQWIISTTTQSETIPETAGKTVTTAEKSTSNDNLKNN